MQSHRPFRLSLLLFFILALSGAQDDFGTGDYDDGDGDTVTVTPTDTNPRPQSPPGERPRPRPRPQPTIVPEYPTQEEKPWLQDRVVEDTLWNRLINLGYDLVQDQERVESDEWPDFLRYYWNRLWKSITSTEYDDSEDHYNHCTQRPDGCPLLVKVRRNRTTVFGSSDRDDDEDSLDDIRRQRNPRRRRPQTRNPSGGRDGQTVQGRTPNRRRSTPKPDWPKNSTSS